MSTIRAAAYQTAANLPTNDSRLIRPATPAAAGASKATATTTPPAAASDRVSLSPEVEVARLRESLGLQPTGKLRRQDFTARIAADQAGVQESLQARLDALAPEAGKPAGALTLTQDAKGQIQVSGDWPGKEALAKELNGDPQFKLIFTRLSANSEVLNFTTGAAAGGEKAATLSDYLDGEAAESNLTSLLQNYAALKNSRNSLASLVSLGAGSGKPYSLSFANGVITPGQ